ncbi:hypothetical protein [Methyloceanibacter caenitepidi]|uniref:Tail assembly chaperone n=1 Tax=Methyloceanibacter caenitepidi TaxID=1384459 RepID=A0A0A8K5W1_9HYPH|nr:hypothetical protein [Methyloceanibacter caenitepidi]BAQ18305.1 hypothetical protein GL4_2872 [Methyloceanibacter caenitepidi]
MDIRSFKRDTEAVESGQWVEDIPQMGGLRLKVRGLGSKTYQAAFARLSRAVPKAERQRDGTFVPETVIRIMGQAAHEAVLLDWDGITEGDGGEAVPYDKDRAYTMLTDPEWRPFLDAVIWAAQVVDNESSGPREELVKNSVPPSAGTSKKAAAE